MAKKMRILLVLLLSGILGFYRLSQVPPALNWDETSIGWNAKTIWQLHIDEYGTRWPISFKSFGDYKAPLYIYLTSPVVGIFGSSEISVRLVSVIAGLVSIGLMYLISGFTAAVLLAISPWHILLSRLALAGLIAVAAAAPLVKDVLGAGGQRFKATSVFYQTEVNLPVTLVKNYLAHF